MKRHTFREKIYALRSICKEYSTYFRYFNNVRCYARGKNIIIIFMGGAYNGFLKRKLPKRDIDKIIKRYRSKLYYEIEKYTLSGIKTEKLNNLYLIGYDSILFML